MSHQPATMAAPTAVPSVDPSFTCFSNLPTEIQDYIWDLAYHTECPRAFFAVLHLAPSLPQPSNDGSGHRIPRPWWQHFQY
ncbi:hypothetical protein BGZ63DRAFT_372519, partial [Mariannaea sp. PMI_226]